MDVLKSLASWFALASACASFMACDDGGFRPEEPAPGEDGLSVQAADGVPAARWTYYAVLRADPRGGLWVARHNQPETKCADGTWQAECYADALDWSRAGLSAESAEGAEAAARELRSILRGKLVEVERDGGPVAVFQATESWEGELAGPAAGTALWLSAPSGCESDACLLTMGTKLNKSGATLNTRYARVQGPAVAAHTDALRSESGLLVVGTADRSATEPAFAVTHGYARRPQSEADSDRTDGPRCSASALTSFPRNELRVHIIDVGQGDAIWVQTPWRDAPEESLDVLIDAGPSGLIPHSSPGGDVVVSYMLEAGLREGDVLDALVVTHAHADHFGGVAKVAETFGIARYADPGFAGDSDAFLETRADVGEHVHEHGGALQVPAVGGLAESLFEDSDLFGPKVATTLLWSAAEPPSGRTTNPTGTDINNTSIALSLRFGGRQVLLMGDVESAVESALVAAHDAGEIDLRAAVLKVAHHGSASSTSSEFLARVFPERSATSWAVISSGRRAYTGSYLPAATTVARLREALTPRHLLSTEDRDQLKYVGTEHGDDHVLVRVKASGQVSGCYVR